MSAPSAHPSITQTLRGASRPVWLLLIGTLINRLGTFLQIYLVLYLTRQGYSVAEAGLALGAYGFGSVAGVLLGGSITSRLGYRWTISGSMSGAGLLTASLVHLASLPAVIVIAAAIGVAAQTSRPGMAALLVELTPEAQHVMVFALYRLAYNLGTIGGPLLGALLLLHSYSLMFYGDAATSIGFAVLALTLPHSAGVSASADAGDAPDAGKPSRSYIAVLRNTGFALFMLALFLNAVVYIQSTSILSLQVTASGHSPAFYAALLSINALVVTCLELPFTKFIQRVPSKVAVALGIGLVGVGMNLYVVGPAAAIFIVATLIWTTGEMIGTPTASAYPGRIAPPGMRPRYIAAAAFSMQIGYVVGPIIGAAVWGAWQSGIWWLCGLLTVAAVLATLAGMKWQRTAAPVAGQPKEMQPTS